MFVIRWLYLAKHPIVVVWLEMIFPDISAGSLVVVTSKRLNTSALLCLDPSWYCRLYWYAASFNAKCCILDDAIAGIPSSALSV